MYPQRAARDSLANEPGSHRFEVIADEAGGYAEGPNWLMKGNFVGAGATV